MIAARANFNYRPGKLYKTAPDELADAPRFMRRSIKMSGCSVRQSAAIDIGSLVLTLPTAGVSQELSTEAG